MAIDDIISMQEVDGERRRIYADLTALCQGCIGAAIASSQAVFCGAQEINGALLALLQSRAKDGLASGQQLAACSSPEAVIEIQLEYAKAMLQAGTDELGRLHALTGKVVAEIMAPLRGHAVVVPKTTETGADTLAA